MILKHSQSQQLLGLYQALSLLTLKVGLWDLYRVVCFGNPFFKWTLEQLHHIGTNDSCPSGTKIFLAPIGQLSTKKEAAGKIRVFAMVDVWTQSALKPLHNYLFSFLKSLPNDGTFDQHASVKRCMLKSSVAKQSFGYDLSAATDRLPIVLQVSVLTQFFGKEFAEA